MVLDCTPDVNKIISRPPKNLISQTRTRTKVFHEFVCELQKDERN